MNYINFLINQSKMLCMISYDKGYQKVIEPVKQKINVDKLNNLKKIQIDQYDEEGNRIFKQPHYLIQSGVFLSNPTHIIDNIYLGSAYNAADYNWLKINNIGLIINVTNEISNYYPNNFEYLQFKISDDHTTHITELVISGLEKIKEYTERENKNILIHCFMGSSRSVSLVIYYLMKEKNMTIEESIKFIKFKRYMVNPSKVFIDDLISLTNQEDNTPNIYQKDNILTT